MIRSTFSFIPGIGPKTETKLWGEGIFTWEDLRDKVESKPLTERSSEICSYIRSAERALLNHDPTFFERYLDSREYWRLYGDFASKAVFLDIETTGLSQYYDVITMIGCYSKSGINLFVKDHNLADIREYLQDYEIIITFNGKTFDVPFLKKELPDIRIPPIHIDLRFLLRSIGFEGPLKQIERDLGIERPHEIKDVNGREASVLWHKFVKGDSASFVKLVLYNIYDIKNLEQIMHLAYSKKLSEYINDSKPLISNGLQKWSDYQIEPPTTSLPCVRTTVARDVLKVFVDNKITVKMNTKKITNNTPNVQDLLRTITESHTSPSVVGIDLSGSEKRPSGFCYLTGNKAFLCSLNTDAELISKVMETQPVLVSIDSPLSLPRYRCCPNDSCDCRKHGITRQCERILKQRGINVYPCLIQSMQGLTMRGINLSTTLRSNGFQVIESYPGAAQDILSFPRKRIDLKQLSSDLEGMGILISAERETVSHDEIDALTSAVVGYFYLASAYEAIGNDVEDYLIIPSLSEV